MTKRCQIVELENNTAVGWDEAQKRLLHNGTKTTFDKVKDAEKVLKEVRRTAKKNGRKTKYDIVEV